MNPKIGPAEGKSKIRLERYKKTGRSFGIAIGIFTLLSIGFFIGLGNRETPFASAPEPPTMAQCMKDSLAVLDVNGHVTLDELNRLKDHCYSLARGQGLLNDFLVRKLNFVQQYNASGVLMGMVVVITISGVLLAALQLFLSYEIALAHGTRITDSNEFHLKQNQIALKSSVTGLIILLISFAFFLIFVLYVYRFEKWEDDDLQKLRLPATLPLGGLGQPPAAPRP